MSLSVAASTQSLEAEVIFDLLQRVRSDTPRVHIITNTVAQQFTANVVLALGAVPSMTIAAEEVAGFAASADALLINLGTLDEDRRTAIPIAMDAAKASGKSAIVDPVFVDRSAPRCEFAREIMMRTPSLVRTNEAEMAALYPQRGDAEDLIAAGSVFAVTGPEDKIESRGQDYRLRNGHPLMARVTATGCAGGAVLAAFSSIEDNTALAAACGLSVFNIAGEIGAERSGGPGTFVPELLDALYGLTLNDLQRRLKTA